MALPAHPNFLTLACRDAERMADFLRALGWPEARESDPLHRVFECTNGVVVALFAASNYEPHFGPPPDGFRAFTLGVNVGSPEEVDAAYAALQEIDGAELLEEPFDSPHGFRGFSFRDPERQHLGRRLEARLHGLARRKPGLVVTDPRGRRTAPSGRVSQRGCGTMRM